MPLYIFNIFILYLKEFEKIVFMFQGGLLWRLSGWFLLRH